MSEPNGTRLETDFLEAQSLLDRGFLDDALRIFLKLYNDGQENQASTIAWIYTRIQNKDIENAKKYYRIASDRGDAYAQYALGGIYFSEGNNKDAIRFYEMAARNGTVRCYHLIYRILIDSGRVNESIKYLEIGAKEGDPFSVRDMAFRCISGKYGISRIPVGVVMYIKNIPQLLKAARKVIKGEDKK